MKKIDIDKDGSRYKWTVKGMYEDACVADIRENSRTTLTDYVGVMFAEQYGCVAEVEKVRLMSHNQYQAYLQRNANRLYTDEGYTLDDYRRDAGHVEILPFQLDKFALSHDAEQYINKRFASISYNAAGDACLRCSVSSAVSADLIAQELDCEMVCNQGLNGFYKNDSSCFILEFCEGDVSLLICSSKKNYVAQLAEFNRFYDIADCDVCLEVYFDNVHVDNILVPRENLEMAISSLVQKGYDGYHAAVKECWEDLLKRQKCPSLGFRVVEAPTMVRDLDFSVSRGQQAALNEVLADATERCAASKGSSFTGGRDEMYK